MHTFTREHPPFNTLPRNLFWETQSYHRPQNLWRGFVETRSNEPVAFTTFVIGKFRRGKV